MIKKRLNSFYPFLLAIVIFSSSCSVYQPQIPNVTNSTKKAEIEIGAGMAAGIEPFSENSFYTVPSSSVPIGLSTNIAYSITDKIKANGQFSFRYPTLVADINGSYKLNEKGNFYGYIGYSLMSLIDSVYEINPYWIDDSYLDGVLHSPYLQFSANTDATNPIGIGAALKAGSLWYSLTAVDTLNNAETRFRPSGFFQSPFVVEPSVYLSAGASSFYFSGGVVHTIILDDHINNANAREFSQNLNAVRTMIFLKFTYKINTGSPMEKSNESEYDF